MQLLGPIVRLQVQRRSLKVGDLGARVYDPSAITAVPSITIDDGGVVGWDDEGTRLDDVHHRDHPASKNGGPNGVSVLFTHHYDAMTARLQRALPYGIAGESILVETDRTITEADLRGGLAIATPSGETIMLESLIVAEPCVEFTRYVLGRPHELRADAQVLETLSFLRSGTRGFYASYRGEPATIQLRQQVFLV